MTQHISRALALMIVTLAALTASAADYIVKGLVVDSIGDPESYATVRIYTLADSVKPAILGTADLDGAFSFKLPSAGNYRVRIHSVGKAPVVSDVTLSSSRHTADLGRIVTRAASTELGEITVTALRPVVSREIDRIGYDVQADDESKTVTLDEILKKVPLVSVDPDGTIKVKGSTNFKIYRNGRPNNSFTRNAKEIFKAIPASMIKRIEVITDPGAREDAEGSSAILNIVTLEQTSTTGVTGNVSLNFNTLSAVPSPNLWLSTQVGKVTLSAYGGYNRMSSTMTRSSTETVQHYKDSGNTLRSSSRSRTPGNVAWFGVDGSWDIDSLNLVTFEAGGFTYGIDGHTFGTTAMTAPDGSTLYSYNSADRQDPLRYHDINGSINYQHSTRLKGETLTLSYMISTTNQRDKQLTTYSDAVNMPVPYTGRRLNSRLNFVEHTVQFDWTRPLGEIHTFDVGAKYINRSNHSVTHQDYFDYNVDDIDFIHRTQVAAAYTDYRLKLGRFGARAGLRYEYSRLSAKYRDGSHDPFGSSLNDLVPNAAVNWAINDANTLKLGYSSRISRPGIDYLSPAREETPSTVSFGNPDLSSSFSQQIDLNYSLLLAKFNLDVDLSYEFSNDGIIDRQWVEKDILYSTYMNGGRKRELFASVFAQWSAGDKTSFSFNGNVSYTRERIPHSNISNDGWDGYMSLRYRQTLPWKLAMTINCDYWLGYCDLYSSMRPRGISGLSYGLSLQRSFLKEDRLTVRVAVRNPFGKRSPSYKVTPVNLGYTGYSVTQRNVNANIAMISISYRFGSMHTSVKKTARSISNDDLVGRGNSGSTGGSTMGGSGSPQ